VAEGIVVEIKIYDKGEQCFMRRHPKDVDYVESGCAPTTQPLELPNSCSHRVGNGLIPLEKHQRYILLAR